MEIPIITFLVNSVVYVGWLVAMLGSLPALIALIIFFVSKDANLKRILKMVLMWFLILGPGFIILGFLVRTILGLF